MKKSESGIIEIPAEISHKGVVVQVPEHLENMALPDPYLLQMYKDMDDRVIWLDAEIDENSTQVVKQIMRYNHDDRGKDPAERRPIRLFLDTPGGDVVVMRSIICAIRMSQTPVYTINFCKAYSAGCHILAAGHRRFALPGSIVMYHNGQWAIEGQQDNVKNTQKFFDAIDKEIKELFKKHTGLDDKTLKKRGVIDWFMDTEEALQNHIIDRVITSFDEIM